MKNVCQNLSLKIVVLFLFLNSFVFTYAQTTDSPKTEYHFSGNISVTNNGISVIPTFSLGKPAAIFNMSLGNQKLSFEPEFKASLEGKPWSLVLWWRYKFLNDDKFKFNIGAHPAISFKTVTADVGGVQRDIIKGNRYLAGELSFSYFLSKNTSIGSYYLYSRGIEFGTTRNTHFLTLNSSFSNINFI